jgi:hypothetical protein
MISLLRDEMHMRLEFMLGIDRCTRAYCCLRYLFLTHFLLLLNLESLFLRQLATRPARLSTALWTRLNAASYSSCHLLFSTYTPPNSLNFHLGNDNSERAAKPSQIR